MAFRNTNQLSHYMSLASKYPILTWDQEKDLARRWRNEGEAAAAERLVLCNLRAVVKIAGEFKNQHVNFEDLVQEGNVGLLEAVKRFEPERGHRLISYAVHWIRAQMQAYVVQHHSMVRIGTSQVQRKLFYRLRRTREELTAEGEDGRPPTDGELAKRLGVSERSITSMRKRLYGRDVSLDATVFDDSERTYGAAIPGEDPSPEDHVADAELSRRVNERIPGLVDSKLDDRERYILGLRLFTEDPWTLERIGKTLGITRERTRQLESRAKAKLQTGLMDLVA